MFGDCEICNTFFVMLDALPVRMYDLEILLLLLVLTVLLFCKATVHLPFLHTSGSIGGRTLGRVFWRAFDIIGTTRGHSLTSHLTEGELEIASSLIRNHRL